MLALRAAADQGLISSNPLCSANSLWLPLLSQTPTSSGLPTPRPTAGLALTHFQEQGGNGVHVSTCTQLTAQQ